MPLQQTREREPDRRRYIHGLASTSTWGMHLLRRTSSTEQQRPRPTFHGAVFPKTSLPLPMLSSMPARVTCSNIANSSDTRIFGKPGPILQQMSSGGYFKELVDGSKIRLTPVTSSTREICPVTASRTSRTASSSAPNAHKRPRNYARDWSLEEI